MHRAGDTAGAFIGLLIATLTIWLTQGKDTHLLEHTFQVIILISVIPAVLAVLVLALGARDIPSAAKSEVPTLSLAGMSKHFKMFMLVLVLFTLGNSSDAFIILRSQERGLNLLQIMGMLLTFNLIYALLAGPLGALSDKIGRRKLILGGWIAYGLVYLGFALSQAGWQIWALYGLYGIYYAATDGVTKAFIADLVPDERRGTAYGLYNATIGLMALPASVIAGLLWQGALDWAGFGPAAPFIFGASLAFLAGVLFWILVPQKQ
jgi:MFS family permease